MNSAIAAGPEAVYAVLGRRSMRGGTSDSRELGIIAGCPVDGIAAVVVMLPPRKG
jgi:hypothetical protein